jgi:DNA helicase-2/ATP-dependent DNA helicase PcrA
MDEYQKAVAGHVRGPIMINAGAGTGKTTVLTVRFAALVKAGRAAASDILAVTFTREAAGVMRERVQNLIGEDVEGFNISTIHSLGHRLLRLGGGSVSVADPDDAYEIFQRAMLEVGMGSDRWDAQKLFAMVTTLKENLVGPEQYQPVGGSYLQESLRMAYTRYQALLGEAGVLDFGDLVLGAVEKLYRDPEFMSYIQTLLPYVMVDEFQDTSRSQYELVRCLVSGQGNVMVTGSPAQTIHEWRGARFKQLETAFARDFPDAPVHTLRVNYRSAGPIVRAASAVGYGYPDAEQVPDRDGGEEIQLWQPANQYEEAGRVAHLIQQLLNDGLPAPSDIAVLYRTHRQADVIESQLSACGIPYVLTGGPCLYKRPEVEDLIAYLTIAVHPNEEGPLERVVNVPPRGLGPNSVRRLKGPHPILTLDVLKAAVRGENGPLRPRVRTAAGDLLTQLTSLIARANDNTPPEEMIDLILELTGYRRWVEELLEGYSRLRAISQVREDASGYDDLLEFLQYAVERAGNNTKRGVCLSTIHMAKGREWPVVIVVGATEGLLPHARSLKQAAEPEEERRLMYVAMTRAEGRLVLSAPQAQVTDKGARSTQPSRYLRLIPRELLQVAEG